MLEVYIPEPLPGVRQLPLLEDPRPDDQRLFQHIPRSEFAGTVQAVGKDAAVCFLLPHNLTDLRGRPEYVASVMDEATSAGKKVIVFSSQDDPKPLEYPAAIIFRPSLYRSMKRPNEIVMPAQVEDLGSTYGYAPVAKGERPTVGFVGKADFDSMRAAVRYYVRNYLLLQGPRREGAYFRRRALSLLAADPRLTLDATRRARFSAHARTIELAPEAARAAYVENMKRNLFTLAPRGDGNYSLRFFETLSLGRIPILIDTDMELPLEDRIRYDRFMVRVPADRLEELPDRVHEFYRVHDEEDCMALEREARAAFEQLYLPAYLRTVLTTEFLAPYL